MTLAWIANPISDSAPCGLDLDAEDDGAFVDYYYDALERIPETYIRPGKVDVRDGKPVQVTPDEVFDPKSVDLKSETAAINALLERSRDLRLLALLAQFECLAGRLGPMTDVIEVMAQALETFGDDIHPQPQDYLRERREAVMELTQPIGIITGLRHMGLVGSATVTLRLLYVADGRLSANSREGDVSGAALRSALAGGENRAAVDETFATLTRMTAALGRIVAACGTGASPFDPNLEPTLTILAEMRDEISSARPDLRGSEPVVETAAPSTDTSDAPQATPAAQTVTALKSHAEARQALVACEVYFARNEPSSASLLLIRQARHLIGQPLVTALEALLPDDCGKAKVDFGTGTGFVIPAGRLKSLSDEGLPQGVPDAPAPDEVADPPTITGLSDVGVALRSVEEFFHARERSSPVPVLLQRARTYLEKSFQEIVDELIPKSG